MQPAGIHHSPIFHIRKQSRVHNLLSEYLGEPTSWDRGPCRSQEDGDSRTCIETEVVRQGTLHCCCTLRAV